MSNLDEIPSFKNGSNLRLNYLLFMSKILVRISIIFNMNVKVIEIFYYGHKKLVL